MWMEERTVLHAYTQPLAPMFLSLSLDEVTWEKTIQCAPWKLIQRLAEATAAAAAVATLQRRLHLTRFRPPSVSLSPLSFSLPPPFLCVLWRIYEKTPPSYILSLFSSDCYRRTDHAVIRDYISRETTSGRGWWKGSCHTRQWRSFF